MAYHGNTPAMGAVKATKHDTNTQKARALWIGTAGTLYVETATGQTLTDFPAKEGLLPLVVTKVMLGGTADDIWLLS
jgi:hypothetical protein